MRIPASYERTSQPTIDLPFGKFNNESSPGTGDGTKILAEQMQDLQYSNLQVLQLAGELPNGELEDGNSSKQFLRCLCNIGVFKYSSSITYQKGTLVFDIANGVKTFYESLINENNKPLTDPTAWKKMDSNGGGGSGYTLSTANSGNLDSAGNADLLYAPGTGTGTDEVPFSFDGTSSTSGNLNSMVVYPTYINAYGFSGGSGGRQGALIRTFATPKGSPLKFRYDYTGGANGEMGATITATYSDGSTEQIFSGQRSNSGTVFQTTSTTLKVVSISCVFNYGYYNPASSDGACNIVAISETITKSISTATTIYCKVGGEYPQLKWRDVNGKQNIAEYIAPISIGQTKYKNVALPANTISSGDAAGYLKSSAFDGNLTTEWASSQAWGVSGVGVINIAYIGQSNLTKPIEYVEFTQHRAGSVMMQTSQDGLNWVDRQLLTFANDVSDISRTTLFKISNFENAPYLRFTPKSYSAYTQPAYSWSVGEVKLYAEDPDGTVTFGEGTKNIILNPDGTTFLNSNHAVSKTAPTNPQENDTWLDISVEPLTAFKFDGENWIKFDGVPIGSATMQNGVIVSVETFEYNVNGYFDHKNWGNAFLDYSKFITIASLPLAASPFVAPCNGLLGLRMHSGDVYINGLATPFGQITQYGNYTTMTIPLSKGDTLYVANNTNPTIGFSCKFYPSKGEA